MFTTLVVPFAEAVFSASRPFPAEQSFLRPLSLIYSPVGKTRENTPSVPSPRERVYRKQTLISPFRPYNVDVFVRRVYASRDSSFVTATGVAGGRAISTPTRFCVRFRRDILPLRARVRLVVVEILLLTQKFAYTVVGSRTR